MVTEEEAYNLVVDLMDFRNPRHWRCLGVSGVVVWGGLLVVVLLLDLSAVLKVFLAVTAGAMVCMSVSAIHLTYTRKGKDRILEVSEIIERGRDRARWF